MEIYFSGNKEVSREEFDEDIAFQKYLWTIPKFIQYYTRATGYSESINLFKIILFMMEQGGIQYIDIPHEHTDYGLQRRDKEYFQNLLESHIKLEKDAKDIIDAIIEKAEKEYTEGFNQ